MNPPEHVEAEIVIKELMKKTEMLFLIGRAENYVKTAQWEMAAEVVKELYEGIRGRKDGGYIQE